MSRWICLLVQPIHAAGVDRLRSAGIETCSASSAEASVVVGEITTVHAVITRDAGLRGDAIRAGRNLRVVANHGVGTNRVDLAAAAALGIPVIFTPYANGRSVAEHTMMLMLAACRRTVAADHATRVGDWAFRFRGGQVELHGKTLGIVGFGSIGQMVARIAAQGFGMRVITYSPSVPEAVIAASGAARAAVLDELLRISDVVSLHRPLRDATQHMIGAREFALMKRSAVLVNTARGALIDSLALAAALRERRIAAAGLDVFETEPPVDDPLLGLDNVVLTPHTGGATEEALRETAQQCADQIIDVLAGRRPAHLVDPSVWDRRRA